MKISLHIKHAYTDASNSIICIIYPRHNTMVWSPYLNYKIQRLDNVQNRFLWFMTFKYILAHMQNFLYQALLNLFDMQVYPNEGK